MNHPVVLRSTDDIDTTLHSQGGICSTRSVLGHRSGQEVFEISSVYLNFLFFVLIKVFNPKV